MTWEGLLSDETFYYTVFIHRGQVEFNLQGLYDWESGKLTCSGTAVEWVFDGQGAYNPVESAETYEAIFSLMDNGHLLYETANGIEMEPQLLPLEGDPWNG